MVDRLRIALPVSVLFGAFLLAGCRAHPDARPADVIVEDAHGGGSVVAFATDPRWLASGGWEGRIRLYGLPEGKVIGAWQAHDGSVNGLAFAAGGERLVSAGYDGRLAEWDRNGTALRSHDVGQPVTDMALDESADRLLTGHGDGTVRVWRQSDWRLLEVRRVHNGAVRAVAFEAGTGRIASSGRDGSVLTWALNGPSRRLPSPPSDARTLVFSTDGSMLYGGGWFDLFQWRLADGALTILGTEHHGIIRSLDLAADGRTLASISRQTDSAVYFLDPHTGATVARFQPHALCGADVAVSKDGRYMATTSDDASVRIWRLVH